MPSATMMGECLSGEDDFYGDSAAGYIDTLKKNNGMKLRLSVSINRDRERREALIIETFIRSAAGKMVGASV
jgi:hypothetical protein